MRDKPCMCGDLYCLYCGPLQGNTKCSIGGKWGEDGGCDDPSECEKVAYRLAEEEAGNIFYEENEYGGSDYNNGPDDLRPW